MLTDEAKALLADVEDRQRKAIDTRDRKHREAMTLRGAATRLRMGYDPEDIARDLRKRGIEIDTKAAEVFTTSTA
jgi:hypothetical protein